MSTVKKVAALAAGAAALTAGGAWYAYRTAFQADPKRIAPVRSIPEGEEYAPHRELILRNTGCHGNCGYAGRTDERIDLAV